MGVADTLSPAIMRAVETVDGAKATETMQITGIELTAISVLIAFVVGLLAVFRAQTGSIDALRKEIEAKIRALEAELSKRSHDKANEIQMMINKNESDTRALQREAARREDIAQTEQRIKEDIGEMKRRIEEMYKMMIERRINVKPEGSD